MAEHLVEIRLTMLSDWHVGTGAGRPGSIDRLVARDDDGLPYVPAKSLTGVWRDACERVAAGLDGRSTGGWVAWVDRIFGDQPSQPAAATVRRPRPAALSVRAARMPESLASHLRPAGAPDEARHVLREALTFVKPGVKIDGRTGRAQDRHLRFIEMGRVGAVLASHATLDVPKACREAAMSLLVAGGLLVERVGGKRRRGAGRCRLELGGTGVPEPDAAIAWLATHEPPPVPDDETHASRAPADADGGPDGDWVALPYELQLDTPAVVAARTVGNVVETFDHVPGTLLLPHVTRAFDALGIDARSTIARGDLRVSPATLLLSGQPGLPVPLAMHRRKAADPDETEVVNGLAAEQRAEAVPLRAVRRGYVAARSPADAFCGEVRTIARTHNVVDDEPQRPTARVGGVYTYEAIAPTVLGGRILLRSTLWKRVAAAPRWREALSGQCRVGRSKKDDYGAARFAIVGEPASPARPASGGPRLLVWVLSDVLVRDSRLRPDPSVGALCRALRTAFDPDGSRGIDLAPASEARSRFVRVRRTESWQQSWGLPRPSLVGLQAGTCLALTVTGTLTAEDLARVEAAGIGERTAEGYGQVSFNDPLLAAPSVRLVQVSTGDVRPRTTAAIGIQDPAYDFAKAIEEQAWRALVNRAALAAGQRFEELLGWQSRGRTAKPTASQLGALRSVVAGVIDRSGAKRADEWLAHLQENEKRAKDWPNGRDGLQQIRALLTDHALVWRSLEIDGSGAARWPTLTADGQSRLRKLLWPVAVRSLLQAAIRACKRSRDRGKPRSTARRGS